MATRKQLLIDDEVDTKVMIDLALKRGRLYADIVNQALQEFYVNHPERDTNVTLTHESEN